MRPNYEPGARAAVMWKKDDFAESWFNTVVSKALHRYAGRVHSLSCTPKRSAIDKRYFAEINRYHAEVNRTVQNEDGTYRHTIFNIKLGTGDDPVEAALDGYRQCEPDDPTWAAFALEWECERMRRTLARQKEIAEKIDRVLDALTAVLRSYNVPLPAAPGEDDDL